MSADVTNLFTETWKGHKYYPGNPGASHFDIRDIAHHLSQTNRYGGAANFPYSVAQHSALMAETMYAATHNARLALDCLFHDASEAYLGDMPKPIKMMLPDYQKIEARTDHEIRQALIGKGVMVPPIQTRECKDYDKRMFLTEWPVLKGHEDAGQWYPDHEPFTHVKIEQWDWKKARNRFYSLARTLTKYAKEENHNG